MKINLGSGKNYREGFLNIDINPMWKPDVVLDVQREPLCAEGKADEILANDVLEHLTDLVSAMTNCLHALKIGGIMDIIVPYDLSLGAWQDPTHVRAFNERSWVYYCEWSWYLGWNTHRFHTRTLEFVFADGIKPYAEGIRVPRNVDAMHVILEKIELTEKDKRALEHYHGRKN